MIQVQDLNDTDIPRSTLKRLMCRRAAIGEAVLAALGLVWRDADGHVAHAATEEANAENAGRSGRKVVRVARRYKGAK